MIERPTSIFLAGTVLTRKAHVNPSSDHTVVHDCGEVPMAVGPSDVVSWERPRGVVHLMQSGKRQFIVKATPTSEHPYFCTLESHTTQRTPDTDGTPLVRSRRSVTSEPYR